MKCMCGCGRAISEQRRFVHGHNSKSAHPRAGKVVNRERFPDPNPSGLCMCGCGTPTTVAKRAMVRYEIEKGQHYRFLRGHTRQTRNPFSWINRNQTRRPRTGLTFNKALGRWQILCRDRSMVYYYRAVMETHLGRPLLPSEQVHHRNGDPADDRIENLELCTTAEHADRHRAENRERIRPLVPIAKPDSYYLGVLRDWMTIHGRPPKRREFDADLSLPDSTTYRTHFGSWSRAVALADEDA